jgi:ribonuclease BN (tRNA processing enzyme)
MRVTIIGSGASWPDSERSSPSQLIVVGEDPLLFDCGPGTGLNLMKAGVNPATISQMFLTHFHIDHSLEFASLVFAGYLAGRREDVKMYGPPGTVSFYRSMFENAYPSAPEIVRRIREDGWNVTPNEVTKGLVVQSDSYRVSSTPVEHGIPALAYRIEAEGSKVVISGDTRPCKSLIELASGADLLIHECSFPDDMVDIARKTNHSTASEVGEVASQAGVNKVVLMHLFPHWKGREEEMVQSARSKFSGEVIPARDLNEINV